MATGGINLAQKYAKQVDERFSRESQALLALNHDFEFTGADTVKVYSIPTVPMTNYSRSGSNRYGAVTDLARNVQAMQVTRDRAFTFLIDRGDKIQSQMVSDAGRALSRQIREVCVPEFDTYVFSKLAAAAADRGAHSTGAITEGNAYECLLNAQEYLGNRNVPDKGRVCFCSYRFANLLRQCPAFMKYGDAAQDMVVRGVLGEVDGVRIVRVPSGRLPAGCAFLLTHPSAALGPRQLEEYKTHDNPPGYSGWLVEGRLIYDCFILEEKADAIYYHGSQAVLKVLHVSTAATDTGKSTVLINPAVRSAPGNKWYYCDAADYGSLVSVTYGVAITPADWTELSASGAEYQPGNGDAVLRVVEVDANLKPVAVGDARLNAG